MLTWNRYLSSTCILLYMSYTLHNIIGWMKSRPFLSRRGSLLYIGTVLLVQPYWILEIVTNAGTRLVFRPRGLTSLIKVPVLRQKESTLPAEATMGSFGARSLVGIYCRQFVLEHQTAGRVQLTPTRASITAIRHPAWSDGGVVAAVHYPRHSVRHSCSAIKGVAGLAESFLGEVRCLQAFDGHVGPRWLQDGTGKTASVPFADGLGQIEPATKDGHSWHEIIRAGSV